MSGNKTMRWGLLNTDNISGTRRLRTLGLRNEIQAFNEAALPGIGSIRFAKQLLLTTAGVMLADEVGELELKTSKIKTCNAIEALASWISLNDSKIPSRMEDSKKPSRMDESKPSYARGRYKLPRDREHINFDEASTPGFYVSQPWRMSTGGAARFLGLVEGKSSRFNSFECSDEGREFVKMGFSSGLLNRLKKWIRGRDEFPKSGSMRQELDIQTPLCKPAAAWLGEHIRNFPRPDIRIANAMEWLQGCTEDDLVELQLSEGLGGQPTDIKDDHWSDIHAGALFFHLRDEAERLLVRLEIAMMGYAKREFPLNAHYPGPVIESIEHTKRAARSFASFSHDPTDAKSASTFVEHEILGLPNEKIVEHLVSRDGRILQLSGDGTRPVVVPGPLFGSVTTTYQGPSDKNGEEDNEENSLDAYPSNDSIQLGPRFSSSLFNFVRLLSDLDESVNSV